MRWSGATGAIARGKRVSTGCGRKRRSVPAWPWICGGKPTPKAVNKPSPHSIVHGLDKPGVFTTVSKYVECDRGGSCQGEVPTGPCWVCGTPATNQCDYRYDPGYKCNRWICFD